MTLEILLLLTWLLLVFSTIYREGLIHLYFLTKFFLRNLYQMSILALFYGSEHFWAGVSYLTHIYLVEARLATRIFSDLNFLESLYFVGFIKRCWIVFKYVFNILLSASIKFYKRYFK